MVVASFAFQKLCHVCSIAQLSPARRSIARRVVHKIKRDQRTILFAGDFVGRVLNLACRTYRRRYLRSHQRLRLFQTFQPFKRCAPFKPLQDNSRSTFKVQGSMFGKRTRSWFVLVRVGDYRVRHNIHSLQSLSPRSFSDRKLQNFIQP